MKNFYDEIPLGYKAFKVIDTSNKKTRKRLEKVSVFLMVIAFSPFVILKPPDFSNINTILPVILITLVGIVMYIILHELTHGIVYKLFTKQKLTFGITSTVAFCGVPNIYVSKKVSLISVLAPFVIYTILLIPVLILIPANGVYAALLLIFSLHFSGCVWDLYVAYVLLKSKSNILMNDTGPKMTFYRLENDTVFDMI